MLTKVIAEKNITYALDVDATLKVVEQIGSTCTNQGPFIVSSLFAQLKAFLTTSSKHDIAIKLINTLQVVLEKTNVPHENSVDYINQLLQLAKGIALDEATLKLLSTVCTRLFTRLPLEQQQFVVNQVVADLTNSSSPFQPFSNPQHSLYLCIVSALLVGCVQQVQVPSLVSVAKQLLQSVVNVNTPEQASTACIYAFASVLNKVAGITSYNYLLFCQTPKILKACSNWYKKSFCPHCH